MNAPGTITVRRYERRDLGRLLVLEKEAFKDDAWPPELFDYYAERFPELFLIAKVDGRIAGYCIGRIRTRTAAEIDSIAVFRRYQRRGVAHQLLRELFR